MSAGAAAKGNGASMSIASISKLKSRDTENVRGTEAQDRSVAPARAWMRDRRTWWAAGGLALLLLVAGAWALSGWFTSDATVSRERVRVATVARGEFVSDVAAQATVVAAVSPELHAPAAGTVALAVQAGDTVKKGQVLATVDSPALQNEYQREQATLDSLSVDIKRQEIEVRRKMLASQQSADMAGVAIRAAEREFARAQAAWDQRIISERDYQRESWYQPKKFRKLFEVET